MRHSHGKVTAPTFAGNATSADKLKTARKINGVAFDGTADITITSSDSSKIPLAGSSNITGNLVPSGSRDLGSNSAKWNNLYVNKINNQDVLSYEVVDSWTE